ncbi:acyl-CoA dehydrogenase family protein [Actinomadura viridis]|uniref:Alkylation response protein AidB-like acyl-CoA dehydrogenase n=1 Tax=Actinomadura viridis TaxID=58110 RepID=A0A931GMP4_9ACTN|nr:acyl-CoA dehydrogenase family protein [Actinomadura viridis]MBG6092882.1 alkylation response protein AidB-like acyl-CoA dehydrogenase [Actinomadura viridis]
MTEDFSARAAAWLEGNAPREPVAKTVEARRFQAALHDAGFAGITWPVEYGGQGLTEAERRAFDERARRFPLPSDPFLIGLGMIGPTLLDLGTPEQKRRFLRPMLRGDEIWCQLFSEPGAGSDVAGLTTRARRDGGGWVIDGQKVWTSRAEYAEWGAVLARTDPDVPRHRGITMFVVDMRSRGVRVRPLRDMTGAIRFNEVFLDAVRLPADAVVGAVGGGWDAAVRMLGHERITISERRRPRDHPASYAALSALARERGVAGDRHVHLRLAEVYRAERLAELLAARLGQEARHGRPAGPRGSAGKLAAGRLARLAADAVAEVAGPAGLAWVPGDAAAPRLAAALLDAPSARIAGGTDEIQRQIIGDRVLGLPREPAPDRDLPFSRRATGTG